MRCTIKHIAIALAVGIALTSMPFILPLSMKTWPLFHWPLLLVDRHFNNWIPLNAGKRTITLFATNVAVWALLSILLLGACNKVAKKSVS